MVFAGLQQNWAQAKSQSIDTPTNLKATKSQPKSILQSPDSSKISVAGENNWVKIEGEVTSADSCSSSNYIKVEGVNNTIKVKQDIPGKTVIVQNGNSNTISITQGKSD